MLMTLMSACHNLSRSVGCALMAASGRRLVLFFFGGEMMVYVLWKVVRSDFMAWFPVDGSLGVVMSLVYRVFVKVIVDFSGCLQFR